MTSLSTSLLLLILLPFALSSTIHDEIARLLKQDQPIPVAFVNDINNCLSGVASNDDTVNCDAVTLAWNTTFLNPAKMPSRCIGFTAPVTNADDDYLEPCIWWRNLYGESASPSITPSKKTRMLCHVVLLLPCHPLSQHLHVYFSQALNQLNIRR
jgi:hypothetical protein